MSIEKGHVFRQHHDKLCIPPERFLLSTDEEDIEKGYMFTDEDYDRLKYESDLVKELKNCEVSIAVESLQKKVYYS